MKKKIKSTIKKILLQEDFESRIKTFSMVSKNRFVAILLNLLYFDGLLVKWRSISALAIIVSQLVKEDIESARVIMRRLMWNLNENSGGIGWGTPEAIGAITAKNGKMANEFGHIFLSYANSEGPNYLEYCILQRGLVWGIGELAHSRPSLVRKFKNLIIPFLLSEDDILRGTAVWALGPIKNSEIIEKLKPLTEDKTYISIYMGNKIRKVSIRHLAKNVLIC